MPATARAILAPTRDDRGVDVSPEEAHPGEPNRDEDDGYGDQDPPLHPCCSQCAEEDVAAEDDRDEEPHGDRLLARRPRVARPHAAAGHRGQPPRRYDKQRTHENQHDAREQHSETAGSDRRVVYPHDEHRNADHEEECGERADGNDGSRAAAHSISPG